MGGKTKTQTSSTTSGPWSEAEPYLKFGMAEAKKQYDSNSPSYYPNSTVASFSPEQQQAFGLAKDRALGGNSTMKAAQGYANDVLGGKYNANPMDSAVFDNIKSKVMPAVNAQFMSSGRYGSGAHADSLARGLTESYAPVAAQQWENGLNRMQSAASMAPTFAQNDYADIAALGDVGKQKQAMAQSEIDDAKARFDYSQDLPANKLGQLMGFVGGNYGGTQTSAQPYYKPSALSQVLGGGLGLASLFG